MSPDYTLVGLEKPRAAGGWVLAGLLVVTWGVLRLLIFQDFIFPLTYALPLLLCVWTRSRPMLFAMAGAFVVLHSVKQFVLMPAGIMPRDEAVWTFAATMVNVGVATVAVDLIIALRGRLDGALQLAEQKREEAERTAARVREQAEELAAQNEELTQQAEELSQQTEELAQHGEELDRQAEELAAQNEELRVQSEEIHGLNAELTHREELLQALLAAARLSQAEHGVGDRLCAAALDLLGPGAVAVLRERSDESLRIVGSAGIPQPAAALPFEPLAGSFAEVVLREGRTASLNDASLRPDLRLLDVAGSRRFASVLAAPVLIDGRPTGIFEVYGTSRHDWTEEQYRLVRWLALQGGQILDTLRLQDATRRQAALIDLSPDATIVKTLDGRISFWSQGAEALYGWTSEEVLGRTVGEVLHTRCMQDLRDVTRQVLESGEWRGELIHAGRDGRDIIVESRWLGRRAPAGQVVEILESNVDVTERKRAEEALRLADQRKNEFLATLSHELRNPLAPIRYAAGLLGRQPTEPAAGASASAFDPREVIDRQVTHLVRLVDDLLDVSRIASNKIRLQRRVLGIAGVVRQAIEASSPAMEAAGHRLLVSLPAEELWLDGDAERLAQVLINLLNNAARYTPDGGTITVSARAEAGEVVVSVKDTGIGLRREDLPSLFQMFSQVGDHGGGLGIGLALVKGVVELHGGRVEARSEGPGQGSEFIVRLPEVPAPAVEAVRQREAAVLLARRILVVDDNPDTAQMMKAMLELDGHEVKVAYDGPAALGVARELQPNLILLDIGLPSMDGYAVARALRADERTRAACLVAVTGWGQEGDRKRARQSGFDAHVTKPADPEEIRRLVAAAGRPIQVEERTIQT